MPLTENPQSFHDHSSPLQPGAVKRLAVFRALRLGDMLCAVPALRALRRTYPEAKITLVGLPWAAQFARRFDRYIDEFVSFPGDPGFPEQPVRDEELQKFYQEMRARRFDLAVQLHGSGQISNGVVREFGADAVVGFALPGTPPGPKEKLIDYPDKGAEPERLLRLVEALGGPTPDAQLEFPLTPEDEQELKQAGLSPEHLPGDYICIHPGASSADKCWPPERFAEVADELAHRFNIAVVLTGSDKEAALTARVAGGMRTTAINAAAPISIGAMAALMSRSRLLISNDTGVSHIAAGLGLPSVVIFITADMERWAPIDFRLHRCISDPQGERASVVTQLASALLVKDDAPVNRDAPPETVPTPNPIPLQTTHLQES